MVKLSALSLVVSASVALATPLSQVPLQYSALSEHLHSVPEGFSIDLDALRLVQFAPDSAPVWITEREKMIAKANSQNFFDITDSPELGFEFRTKQSPVHYGSLNSSDLVKPVLKTLSTKGPRENLEKFTSFRTRYYRSSTGRDSQLWLLSKINEITAQTASSELRSRISVSEFEHSWDQNSIILKLAGTSPVDEGSVIISAHQDSTNQLFFLSAPGADDDGSGTVTILEVYRALLAANYTPVHNVEWHFYSAEEGGLLGSQAVVSEYLSQGAKVKAQLQFDMTAYVKKGTTERIGLITDFVDPTLTTFLKTLVEEYLSIPWVETKCQYACSDHASWNKAGYPSAFSIESSFEDSNKLIHSSNDRLDAVGFSFDHALEFSKLGVAYVIEVAGWSK